MKNLHWNQGNGQRQDNLLKKRPLSTPSVYFTFASILPKIAKASMCDTNLVEAAQNASENNHQHQIYSGAFKTIFVSVQKEIVSRRRHISPAGISFCKI